MVLFRASEAEAVRGSTRPEPPSDELELARLPAGFFFVAEPPDTGPLPPPLSVLRLAPSLLNPPDELNVGAPDAGSVNWDGLDRSAVAWRPVGLGLFGATRRLLPPPPAPTFAEFGLLLLVRIESDVTGVATPVVRAVDGETAGRYASDAAEAKWLCCSCCCCCMAGMTPIACVVGPNTVASYASNHLALSGGGISLALVPLPVSELEFDVG